jgi:hypothetical protein
VSCNKWQNKDKGTVSDNSLGRNPAGTSSMKDVLSTQGYP